MRQAYIQVRLSEMEKDSIRKAAKYFGESISEFIRRGALVRLRQGKAAEDEDPFLRALHELTKGQEPEPVPTEVAERVERFRRSKPKAGELLRPGEAAQMVRKEISRLQAKH